MSRYISRPRVPYQTQRVKFRALWKTGFVSLLSPFYCIKNNLLEFLFLNTTLTYNTITLSNEISNIFTTTCVWINSTQILTLDYPLFTPTNYH